MTVGVLLTLSPSRVILARQPFWPWPKPGEYPITLLNGNTLEFFPSPYYHFPLRGILNEQTSPSKPHSAGPSKQTPSPVDGA